MPSDHLSNGPRPPFHQEIEILAVAVTSWHLIWAATVALSVSWLGLVAYRVYFHPLAKFPGPRLAAATSWYEFYYDVVKDGMMCYQLPKLHARYGPIVRVNPRELHINDPGFYHEIYRQNTVFLKDKAFYHTLGFPTASVSITDPLQHRQRRDILNPFFSKRTIVALSPKLHNVVGKLLAKMSEYVQVDQDIPLQDAFHCMTVDFISEYAFGSSFAMLDTQNFNAAHVRSVETTAEMQWLFKHFPLIRQIAEFMPRAIASKLDRGMVTLVTTCEDIVGRLISQPRSLTQPSHETVFDALLSSSAAISDHREFVDEAMIILAAGTETTAIALTYAVYYILRDSKVESRLLAELRTVPMDCDGRMNYNVLENLSYLTACIKETLRLSHAVPGKLPRIVPAAGTTICGMYVPPGTVVGTSHYVIHNNSELFPEPTRFLPERWLGDQRCLEKWLVSFSKGSRACLGINLAYAELYLTLAKLLTTFEMTLWETSEQDMRWKDHGVTHNRGNLRVRAKKRDKLS